MKVSALLPVKGFANAKQRLSPLLNAEQRALLAEAMAKDVLREVALARGLEATYVVTGDAHVAEMAPALGAQVIMEKEETGETDAVLFALAAMRQRGIEAALVIPGDIPLVRAGDIEVIIEQVAGRDPSVPFALLVPSQDRLGTNALLLSPPDLIPLRFGYDSFTFHLSQVAAQGLPLRVLDNPRVGLDIDEPGDLERYLSKATAGETYRLLLDMVGVDGLQKTRRAGGS